MVTTGNLNLSPEALAALAQKANRSDNELARSLGISMDEIVDAQLPDTDANNKQIFESNPFFDPTKFGQALAANARVDAGGYITAEEINKSENGNDEENDLLDIIQNNLAREEAERARIKAWDEAPSLDYPGLTNAQVLSGLRTICANLPAYTNRAVQNGWIKPEEENEFAAYMRRELWLKEQQRLGHTNTPEYIAAQHQQDQANQQHPGWHDHAVTLNKEANGLNIDIAQDQTHSEVTAAVGGIRTNASVELFNGVDSTSDNLRYDSQFHEREELIRPASDSNDAKGVLREGDKGLEIIGSPKSVWHENDGNEFKGINKRDFLQSGDDITTGGVNAHGLSASKDFNKAVAVSGVLNPNIDLNPQIPNRPVASITDFRMNDML